MLTQFVEVGLFARRGGTVKRWCGLWFGGLCVERRVEVRRRLHSEGERGP